MLLWVSILQAIVEETRDLPDTLAQYGRVAISRKQTARLIGQVGLQGCLRPLHQTRS
jgi:uncharacterized Rmd1/YagE family protein